jgi:hypothetical protein
LSVGVQHTARANCNDGSAVTDSADVYM